MATKKTSKLVPLSEWYAQILRITVFHSQGSQIKITWQDVTGEFPETQLQKTKENINIEEGIFNDCILQLRKHPQRIDLVLQPSAKVISERFGFPNIGKYNQIIENFIELSNNLFSLDEFPSCARLAFGATVYLNVDDRKSGYKFLDSYLRSVKVDSNKASDFLFRINHPKDIMIDSEKIKINRLTTWTVPMVMWFGPLNMGDKIDKVPPFFGFQIDLDINTDQDNKKEFPKGKVNEILAELVNMTSEIITKGEPK